MEKISKPHIVEFLRMCDRKHWLHPRIRYASIRSKPQLLADLKKHYRGRRKGKLLLFRPIHHLPLVPKISYDFGKKQFLYDGVPNALPIRGQEPTRFHIVRGPVTLTWPQLSGSPREEEADFSRQTSAELFERSRRLNTGFPPGCSSPNPPWTNSVRIPSSGLSDHPAWDTRTQAESQGCADFSYL